MSNSNFVTATVETVDAGGVTLILPGSSTATQKKYPRLDSETLTAGDRVLCAQDSGCWVVLGKLTGGVTV